MLTTFGIVTDQWPETGANGIGVWLRDGEFGYADEVSMRNGRWEYFNRQDGEFYGCHRRPDLFCEYPSLEK
jgi:hypothetical protein